MMFLFIRDLVEAVAADFEVCVALRVDRALPPETRRRVQSGVDGQQSHAGPRRVQMDVAVTTAIRNASHHHNADESDTRHHQHRDVEAGRACPRDELRGATRQCHGEEERHEEEAGAEHDVCRALAAQRRDGGWAAAFTAITRNATLGIAVI
jgi:hypothetical protein